MLLYNNPISIFCELIYIAITRLIPNKYRTTDTCNVEHHT